MRSPCTYPESALPEARRPPGSRKVGWHSRMHGVAKRHPGFGRPRRQARSSATLEWAFEAPVRGITRGQLAAGISNTRLLVSKGGRAGLTIDHAPSSGCCGAWDGRSTETYRCFNCHATGVKGRPDLSSMRPGIECRRCHGPGKRHMENPRLHRSSIRASCRRERWSTAGMPSPAGVGQLWAPERSNRIHPVRTSPV